MPAKSTGLSFQSVDVIQIQRALSKPMSRAAMAQTGNEDRFQSEGEHPIDELRVGSAE